MINQANVSWRSLVYRVLISTCRFYTKKSESSKALQREAEGGLLLCWWWDHSLFAGHRAENVL
jgi:hypothetical protein